MAVSAASSAASGAACPASSPLILFLTALLNNISTKREAERARQAQQKTGPLAEYDFVVVGGGTAGCVLAARLSENSSASVLVLERGGTEPEEARVPAYFGNNINSALMETLNTQPDTVSCNGKGCVLNVPSVLGGGSVLNGMLYVRGNKVDYETWAKITGDKGWGYENVLRYFKKAEDNQNSAFYKDTKYHGRGGPLKVSWYPYRHPTSPLVLKAFKEAGVPAVQDFNAESQLGYTVPQTNSAGGERWSTYRSYLEPVLKRPNLRVETFATARKLVLEGSGAPRAAGVEYQDAAGKIRVVKARRGVVLTAGALHSPQLLMLSGIGPADHLKALGIPVVKDLPVGKTLFDHPALLGGVAFKCQAPLCVTDWQSRLKDIEEYKANRTGPLSALNPSQAIVFAKSTLSGEAPDLEFMFLGNTVDSTTCAPVDSWRVNTILPLMSLTQPVSEGWLRLNSSDPHAQPVVKLNYFGDAKRHDLAVAVQGLKTLISLERSLAAEGIHLDRKRYPACLSEGAFGSDAYLRCAAKASTSTTWHWSGTCRMGGPKDARAVLDAGLRVKGVAGLWVADGGAMPSLPAGNTNNPIIMLAERAADLIKQHSQ